MKLVQKTCDQVSNSQPVERILKQWPIVWNFRNGDDVRGEIEVWI